jgi:(p)ppGpp synthase/HD superfamily hydrolase
MVNNNLWSPDLYQKAWKFTAEAHNGQKVPGTDLPYIVHISNVTMEVLATLNKESFNYPDLAMQCALLHDTLEDTSTTEEEIRNNFGAQVLEGVKSLTKDESFPSKSLKMNDSLKRIIQQPREIWIVKMGDRVTDLQPPPKHWSKDKVNDYREESELIYHTLKEASPYLSERLLIKIEHYNK